MTASPDSSYVHLTQMDWRSIYRPLRGVVVFIFWNLPCGLACGVLQLLAIGFVSTCLASGNIFFLHKGIQLQRIALKFSPALPRNRQFIQPYILVIYLRIRFDQLGAIADLDESILFLRTTLELCPLTRSPRPIMFENLANGLHIRFKMLGAMTDLDEAVSFHRIALELCPAHHNRRSTILHNLAICAHTRFEQSSEMADLDEAIALNRGALVLFPTGYPDRSMPSPVPFVQSLFTRTRRSRTITDRRDSATFLRSIWELPPTGYPDRAGVSGSLAISLFTRFQQLGATTDLDEAVTMHRDSLARHSMSYQDQLITLTGLGTCLAARFEQLGLVPDLEEATTLLRAALEMCPATHSYRSAIFDGLSISLHVRFEKLGLMADLDEAIASSHSALELQPPDHPYRCKSLTNLALRLSTRFKQTGVITDLDDAIAIQRTALGLCPPRHFFRSLALNNLATFLLSRYWQRGVLADLDEAIALYREALELRPTGHGDRAVSLTNLGGCLSGRFERSGAMVDLDEGIALLRVALELCPPTHALRSTTLSSLSICLCMRFSKLQEMVDLDEGIALRQEALGHQPPGHPYRCVSLRNLAVCFINRWTNLGNVSDLEKAFEHFSRLKDVPQVASLDDLNSVKEWVRGAEQFRHHTTVLAYQTSLHFLINFLATLPSLPQNLAVLKQFSSSLAVDAFSGCIRHGAPADAVELLEQGRGVFWRQLTRLRSPLDQVAASGDTGKALAEKFTQLTALLRNISNSPSSSQHDQAWHLNVQLHGVMSDIRKLPGFSRFLQPPLFSDLQQAAKDGPVIIVNASQHGCDALVILSNQDPIHIPLQIVKTQVLDLSSQLRLQTTLAKVNDVTKDLVLILRELWNSVVYPIMEVLRELYPPPTRIWWCPTAEFSLLPLHAAGVYRKGQPNLSDLYISSYTPTLTALILARNHILSHTTIKKPGTVIIGQAHAPGENALASVHTELEHIARCLSPVASITCIEGKDATIASVSNALHTNEFVHLACHGIPDPQRPFESAFALGDGHLKIEDIMRYDLQNARFAFLSACHTTVGDVESPDEVIHLAAAMQFSGFPSVVGTMWAVDDAHANKITSMFYNNMVNESGVLDHTLAALALHKTLRRSSNIPFDQRILFIHIGA